MRVWIILALVGLLCGCQQPGASGGLQSQSAARQAGEDELRFFEPEFSALIDQVVTKLEDVCSREAAGREGMEGCVRDEFASAFDDSKQGRKNCAFLDSVAEYIGCVAVGNTFIDIRHRLSDDSPVPAGFWREKQAMVDALVDTMAEKGVDVCGVSDSDRVLACVMEWFSERVALPGSLTERCDAQDDADDRYGCIVEAVMLRYLQDHVPRLGAVNT